MTAEERAELRALAEVTGSGPKRRKRRQAERQEATIRMLRGGGAGHEIVVWVWVAA